jgi:pullulanase
MTWLLDRKKTHFVLWRPAPVAPEANPPALVIGQLDPAANPPALTGARTLPLAPSPLSTAGDLWEIAAADCGLRDGQVYHYWFQVSNANVYSAAQNQPFQVTDPAAWCTDWRLTSTIPAGDSADNPSAAAVVRFLGGRLVPTDPQTAPQSFAAAPDAAMQSLPPNNQLVLYELPTAWTKTGDLVSATHVGV